MMKRVALWIVRLEWPMLAVLSPLFLFPNAKRSLALVGIPLIWMARKIARGHFIRRTPLDWAIALLMFMVLVSLYATYDIAVSLPKIAGILLGIAVFYALAEINSAHHLRWAVTCYLAGGFGLTVLGILGTQRLTKIPVLSGLITRLPAVFQGIPGAEAGFHPNEVAGTLLWFIPLYYALAASAWRRWRRRSCNAGAMLALGVAGLAATGVLVLTQSRSGILGLGLSLLLLLALAGRAGRVAASLMVAASVLAVVIVGPGRVGDILMGGHDVATNVTGTMDAGSRLEIWSRALYALADFPFTGMGLNVFRHIVPVMYPLFLVSPDVDIAHAHNHLLQVAVELGLPGLVAYVAIGLISTAMLVGVWRRSNRDQLPALAAGLGTGLLAYFIYGLTDTVALGAKPSVALWALLGLVVATFSLTDREKSERGALPVPMVQMTGQTSALSRD